ncbi:hypothetical protein [Mucilaginibacter sp. HD30]
MRILFICSSLEPGRDGVGDYARRLAEAFKGDGHHCALLSLNDAFVKVITTDSERMGDDKVPVLRIPHYELTSSLTEIKLWIDDFDPDWLSFQYVIFGFHDKGLPFNLSKSMLIVSGRRRWHIMFHELWVGMAIEQSTKFKLWGLVQKRLIASMIAQLKPRVIHTQTRLYHQILTKMGYKVNHLPLYSNIPVHKPEKINDHSNEIRLVVFGTIHNNSYITEFAADAGEYTLKNKLPITLYFIGICGNEQQNWINICENAGLKVKVMGEQPADLVSDLLQNATLGISSTAAAVLDKSGSFAAMHAHKLPVINIAKPWRPIGINDPEIPSGVLIYKPGKFDELLAGRTNLGYTITDPLITARNMIDALNAVV